MHYRKEILICSCGYTLEEKYMITLKEYLTASGRYPDREKHEELTPELIKNAETLLDTVNKFLSELGVKNKDVTSGFRPSAANAATAGAAKKSAHTICLAIDLMDDKDQTLAKLIESRPDLLKKYGLWLEDKDFTKGKNTNWVHLDLIQRPPRPVQIFKP
jgi:hypothetical protein